MKKYIFLLGLGFALSCFNAAFSQTIEKSESFIMLFGTKYYLHTIKEGQTLETIAKAYNTTVQEIKMNNQGVQNFQAGVLIKVPVIADSATPANKQEFVYHKVERKQTLYSICKKYGVTEEDIYKYNPQTRLGLKTGETLQIPVGKNENPDREDINFIYHTVKQNESFNSISQLYGVEISDIVKYNTQAKYNMKPGDVLRIPKIYSTSEIDTSNLAEGGDIQYSDDQIRKKAMLNADYCDCATYKHSFSKTLKISLMLPLFLADNRSLSEGYKSDPSKNALKKNSERIYEFYEGFLIAVKEFQQENRNIQVNIYDTKNNTSTTDEILMKPELKNSDLIIGPLYTDNVAKAAKFANANHIPMVSPFAVRNTLLNDNPYLFQFTPSAAASIYESTDFFGMYENARVIAVHGGTPSELEHIKYYKENLTKNLVNDNRIPGLIFKEIDFNNGGLSRITEAMSPTENNIILIPGNDEVLITQIINHLTTLQKTEKYKVVLFGSQSWERYSNIDIEFLQSMSFSFRSPSFIDYGNDRVKNFVSQFRTLYNAEPGIYGFSGYDIAKFFIGELIKHGKYFQFCLGGEKEEKGLVYKFNFQRVNPAGGFENRSNYVLKYGENFTVEPAY
ncbi:MAG: LysM peptidoglycan-binding domain-containing protein [Bacteroidales bacterium]|nr:LysM peptidoglycan-binding domain-containing protein [Bacteroidales bacterium]MEE3447083.1 LysM peptidoglycan-binding domain-containing protein [Bacteroidales bacterium]